MVRTLKESVALDCARETGATHIGLSVFDGRWYTGNVEQLLAIGCATIKAVQAQVILRPATLALKRGLAKLHKKEQRKHGSQWRYELEHRLHSLRALSPSMLRRSLVAEGGR